MCVQPEKWDLSLVVAMSRQADPLGFLKCSFSTELSAFMQPPKYLLIVIVTLCV